MLIVDSSVWIQAFRVDASFEGREVDRLLARGEVGMVGVVLAEVLQGSRSAQEFESLRIRFMAIPYPEETQETWVRVGNLSYQLRQCGQAMGIVGLLIVALALEYGCAVYTLDEHFQRIPGLELHQAGQT